MLCPKCGTNVGDLLTLCERCKADQVQTAERASAEQSARAASAPPTAPRDNRRLIGMLGGAVAILMFALAGLLTYQHSLSQSSRKLSSADQALLSTHFNRCVTAFSGNQAFFSSTFAEVNVKDPNLLFRLAPQALASADPKQRCAEARDQCAEDLTSLACRQWMKSNNLFFSAVKACQLNGFASFQSAECKEFFDTCVKAQGEGAACEALQRHYGADSPRG
ncbi:MAG: hypothetical protein U0136_09040 [Bdellovibrionota bacterium]